MANTEPLSQPNNGNGHRSSLSGRKLNNGRYTVIDEIARGGMGFVLLAQDNNLNTEIAIKGMQITNAEEAERFRREARSAARLKHENIINVYNLFPEGNHFFYAMEKLDGKDLQDIVLNEYGRMGRHIPLDQAAAIFQQMGSALTYAHEKGVIHRDLKGAQIMIDRSKNPWKATVTDFGLAKMQTEGESLTQTGTAMGTPVYFAPEVFLHEMASKASTHHVDIYGLGIIALETLIGKVPLKGDFSSAIKACSLISDRSYHTIEENRKDLPKTVARHLDEVIINKGMAEDINDRYQSAQELAHDIAEPLLDYAHSKSSGSRKRRRTPSGSGHTDLQESDAVRMHRSAMSRTFQQSKRSASNTKGAIIGAIASGALAVGGLVGVLHYKSEPADPAPVEQPSNPQPENPAPIPTQPVKEEPKSYLLVQVDGNRNELALTSRAFEKNENGIYLPTGEGVDIQPDQKTGLEPGRHLLYVSTGQDQFRVPYRTDEDSTQRLKVFVPSHPIQPGFVYINSQEGREYCFQISQKEISIEQYLQFVENTWARRTAGHELKRRVPGFPVPGDLNAYTHIFERARNGTIVPTAQYQHLEQKLDQPVTGLTWGIVRDDYVNWAGVRGFQVPEGLRLGIPSARQMMHVVTAGGLFDFGNRDAPQTKQEQKSLEQYLTAINSMETFGEFVYHNDDINAFGIQGAASGAPEEYIFTEETSAGNKNINILNLTRVGYKTKPQVTRNDAERDVNTGFRIVLYDQR